MPLHVLAYWLRNFLALGSLLLGLWLILLFDSGKSTNIFLNSYHTYLGLGSLVLGILIAVGASNTYRILLGLGFLVIGILLFSHFMTQRQGWIGQLMTNFISPAICFLGIFTMVDFKSDARGK
jgi:hypothetical protein